jgi:hypothetical protein
MPSDETLLSECGLTHIGEWDTFFTKVKLLAGKTPTDFYQHFNTGWKSLSKGPHNNKIKVLLIGRTLGFADVLIVWQTENGEATKAFEDTILVSSTTCTHTCETAYCIKYRLWGSVPK